MKEKKNINHLENWAALILAVLTVISILVQILISTSRQLSPLETSLFSVLQFIFSLGFAWVLAKISFRSEFVRSQKQFAIAAFRRIKEIDMTVERVLFRINSQMKIADANTLKELDVIFEIAKGIRQSIKSSIADWSDIIGEELATIEKIESLTFQEEIMSDKIKNEPLSNSEESKKILEILDQKQKEVTKLVETLPPSLQVETKKRRKSSSYELVTKELQKQVDENEFITVDGFWTEGFQKDIKDFKIGDKLVVQQGDVEDRIGSMIAYDENGNSIGVILNGSENSRNYADFFDILSSFIRKSKFQIELLNIEAEPFKGNEERHYFTAKIL